VKVTTTARPADVVLDPERAIIDSDRDNNRRALDRN
jgi:hypothetical protein